MNKRHVYIISDSTGITAQTLAQSIVSQFEDIKFQTTVIPYVDSIEKAQQTVERINSNCHDGERPIIFDTVIAPNLSEILSGAQGMRFDVLNMYLAPLQVELGQKSTLTVGKAHGRAQDANYKHRIDAVHFAMENDDGAKTRYYDKADVILIGVSRCGKTPTCLYLALQFGIYAANYPITEEDIEDLSLPKVLKEHKHKLFGLTIAPDRLSLIRNERRANSKYASLRQCQNEVREVEGIFRRHGIDFINTTDSSIEEIAATMLDKSGLHRS
ncbi:Phosphoenolpyruvate synthase regulatory protein [BD1-7 clade bacterium]|uniref:Putative phosphoenolpyruvate synthase regulatory protein n=1 Tax=BD1-7 clade bacterium TaxID=2029982 RepID=A0A5S9QKA9_9GAMM|nr:Phosphoenolpyruvate synthase regulatory protein [BD1-7 clade bacterium]